MSSEQAITSIDIGMALTAMEREVQRKLGQNLIRLQQVERMLKDFWVGHDVFGTASDLADIQKLRKNEVADKTLGTVKQMLLGSYITSDLDKAAADSQVEPGDPTNVTFGFRSSIRFSEANFAREKAELDALVILRNDLVHHFVERFDLSCESGCVGAGAYLDECHEKINHYVDKLRAWSDSSTRARELLTSFMNSSVGEDFFFFGIMPGCEIKWDSTPIVALLRRAEESLAENGWTSLDAAVVFMRNHDPELTPSKYGCRRWRHLIHESRLFETKSEKVKPAGRLAVFFRSKSR